MMSRTREQRGLGLMNIGIVGLGLIGASMAKSIKRLDRFKIYGYDISSDVISKSLELGIIDEVLPPDKLSECDIVLLALYSGDTVNYINTHYDKIKPEAIIVDTCGVKKTVCEELFPLAKEKSFNFIGGHPMAGLEFSGFNHSVEDLFDGASMILVPDETREQSREVNKLKALFLEIGFGQIVFASAEEHDKMIAYTSQLAHIVSSAYIKNPFATSHKGFSAGSFHDMTRVAKLNETMWTELFMDNKSYLVSDIDILMTKLSEFRDAITDNKREKLMTLLKEGREIREALL
jgi:prephenate dehydrogenase